RRWPTSCAGWVRFAPTSPAPAPPSTASSCTAKVRVKRSSRCRPKGEPGSPHQRGTVDFVAYTQPAIEAGTTRTGRWLRQRRIKIAPWTAVVEGPIAAFSQELGRWTILALAIIVPPFSIVAGRRFLLALARAPSATA